MMMSEISSSAGVARSVCSQEVLANESINLNVVALEQLKKKATPTANRLWAQTDDDGCRVEDECHRATERE